MYTETKAVLDQRVRAAHSRDASPYEVMLERFAALPLKHPLKHEFLLLCWQQQWPEYLKLESDGVLNDWAIRMAKAMCFARRLFLLGCGSSGKTQISSAYVYTFWKARPFNTSVFLSTTSAEAGESRTWGAVKDLHKNDQLRVGKRIESLRLITLDEEIRDEDGVKERDFRDVIKCVNIKPGAEGKNVMAAIVGRKNEHVLWCCDEYAFMDTGVLNARVNLNTNPFHQFFGLSNAPEEGDPMYIDAMPFGEKYPDGWKSIDKDRDLSWPTETGLCLYFNGLTSPNYKATNGKIPFPRLMHEGMRVEIMRDARGEDTPMYWKQFYGFPPSVDISDKAFTIKFLEGAGAFREAEWASLGQKMLAGLDLGFRHDGDPCVIDFGKIGKAPSGRTILAVEGDAIALTPRQGAPEAFEVQIARQVLDECGKRGCHDLALDVTGDGGILLQHIEREARARDYVLNVLPVSFSGAAEDRVVIPNEKRSAREMFHNMVAQLWISLRISCANDVIRGMGKHTAAVQQLCARKLGTDDRKKQTIEPKKEMKKRIRRSPDHADARVLLHHLALRHGLSGMPVVVKKEPFDPRKFLQKQAQGRYDNPHRSIYGDR